MANRPLLVFPQPGAADRSKRSSGPQPQLHLPSHNKQGRRLTPKFEDLRETFVAQRALLQSDPIGAPPEQVVVFETIGPVDSFLTAVRHTQGMSWLADWGEDDISPDEDFYNPENREANLSGRLYLVMISQQAIDQLISLWGKYKRDRNVTFDRGQNGWKKLFEHLHDIRRWGIKDRLEETGILEDWEELVSQNVDPIRFEAELWCRQTDAEQRNAYETFSSVVQQEGGRCLTQSCVPEIAYHGVLVEAPARIIRPVLADQNTKLVRSDQVMFFRPTGQTASPFSEILPEEDIAVSSRSRLPLPQGDATLALLDGLPLENHACLSGRLIIDDPDGWASAYQANERYHGTGMASLIIHSELNEQEPALMHPLYVRPIMKPDSLAWRRQECIPHDVLAVDLVHRATRRMLEGDGQVPATAPNVRIVNFSIGDPSQPFNRFLSPLARLLDWLAYRYNLLFIVSSGNTGDPIELAIDSHALRILSPEEIQTTVWKAVKISERNRALLSPAESINALTIGATHSDSSPLTPNPGLINPCANGSIPSPYSRLGPGFRRSVKPELLVPGGRQLYRESPLSGTRSVQIQPTTSARPPGQLVAAPGRTPGDTKASSYTRGTSNSAAVSSRNAAMVYDVLVDMQDEPNGQLLSSNHLTVLTKTLLVHGARWGIARASLEPALCDGLDERSIRSYMSRYLGYGLPDFSRVVSSTDQRATILGCGDLKDGEAHLFRIPLPHSLSGNRVWRRLIISLAWLSPINPRERKYRKAQLWLRPSKKELGVEAKDGWWQDIERGTAQHIVLEGESATIFADDDHVSLLVNCRADAGKLVESVPYGLAVTLEVEEETNIPIYDEIRIKLLTPVRITP